jgi:hypothetical protein
MPLGLMYQRDSYYNYGTISPNNIIMHVNTYTTGSYTGAGTVWRDLSGYGNNMSLISTLFTGAIGLNGGISFNGTGSYCISSNDLISYMNTSNFNQTQEVWIRNVYYNITGTQGVIIDELGAAPPTASWHAAQFEIIGNTGTISVWNGSLTNRVNLGLFTDQSWHHVAWRYESSGILSGYLDGVKKGSVNVLRTNTTPGYYPALGYADATNMGNGNYYKGLIGAYRNYNRAITDSEILQNYNYEKNFFFLPSFSAFFTVTQYLSVPASTDWVVGTGDITVEWWQNLGGAGQLYPRIFSIGTYGNASLAVSIEGSSFNVFVQGVPNRLGITISNFSNTWVHFAVVRSAGVLTSYQNGTSIGSVANSNSISNSTTQLNIGYGGEANTAYNGYISQFRWTNSAVYTGNFPKPTSILQALPQTKLLLLFSSAADLLKDSSGLGKVVTNNSGVTWNSSKPF